MRRPGMKGFTLVELMITVVIISILAAVAYPSYDRYVIKSRRSDAQQLLTGVSSKQAQYILDARSYTDILGSGGLNISRDNWTCATTNAGCTGTYYTVAISTLTNTATPPFYRITATPVAGKSNASDGNLTLDSTGAKTGTW